MPDADDRRDLAQTARRKTHRAQQRPAFECIALLLQGGGALGAYQAGVYQALSEAHLPLNWIAGISIGAINAALIAGNPPQARVEKLRKFWELVTTSPFALWGRIGPQAPALHEEALHRLMSQATAAAASTLDRDSAKPNAARADDRHGFREGVDGGAGSARPPDLRLFAPRGDTARAVANQLSAGLALVGGASGFFAPRLPVPWLQPAGTVEATSYYDTAPLRATLGRLVDFDRINAGEMRFSVGAVNVATGNFRLFRQHHAHDRARACHGERRAAAGVSRRRNRRRTVLGRRPCFEHADAMGARKRAAPRHARVSD
jgi:NTE family protein